MSGQSGDGFIKRKFVFVLQLAHFSLAIVFRALVESGGRSSCVFTFRNGEKESKPRKLFARRLNNWLRPISFISLSRSGLLFVMRKRIKPERNPLKFMRNNYRMWMI
jgi:hypothetical protein